MTGTTGACLHGGGYRLVTEDVVTTAAMLKPVQATLFSPLSKELGRVLIQPGAARNTLRIVPMPEPLRIAARTDETLPPLVFSGYYRIAADEPDDRAAACAALGAAFLQGPPAPERPLGQMPSAFVYFGQFLAHELSRLKELTAESFENLHSARLDLETILWADASGTEDVQQDLARVAPLLRDGVAVGRSSEPTEARYADIPRSFVGAPKVPDPRSDANLALAQMHVAIVRHYVNLVDRCGQDARQRLLAEIHEITLHDFLPRIVPPDVHADVLANGRRMVMPGGGDPGAFQLPIEFAAAAFRFGHSLVRQSYHWSRFDPGSESLQALLQQTTSTGGGLDNHPADRHRCLDTVWEVDWTDMIGPTARNVAPLISASVAPQLGALPAVYVDGATRPVNLAQLNLDRGRQLRLASAQRVRDSFPGLFPDFLTEAQMLDALPGGMATAMASGPADDRLLDRTPLWFYVLREAAVLGGGARLGPLGGRLVMETIHAAICAALGGPPPPAPTTPFTLEDLLKDLHPVTSP